MVADPSSSLGLFAVIWSTLCALSSVLVTGAMMRSDEAVPASGSDQPALDETDRSMSA